MSRNKKPQAIKYSKLVGEDTFLGKYLRYLSSLETANAYDFWSGCWLLTSAVGRNIIIDRPGAPVFLNLYCILVAESGITRKSTSVRHATEFARTFRSEVCSVIETKTTPEMLWKLLAKQSKDHATCSAVISISELATFLGREKYVETMPALLTDLYDCPSERIGGGTLASGELGIKNAFVSFLSASTPSWLLRAINPDVIEGGFTSRVLFIVSEAPKQLQPWPEPLNEQLKHNIEQSLTDISTKAKGLERIQISDGARKTFGRWYKSRTIHRDPFRSSFQSREDAHILRLAGILSINDNSWVIQHNHIVAAIKVITQVREDGASIFEGTGSTSRQIIGIDKIREKLLSAGQNGLPQREITKAVSNYMNAAHMKAVLDIMHELQMVQQFQDVQVSRGRPVTIWRGTKLLLASNAIDKIIEEFEPNG